MCDFIRKFLRQFDLFPAPATLRTSSEPQTKTATVGLISLAVSCAFIFIFVQGCINMFQFQNISYTESKTNTNGSQIYGSFNMFGVTLMWQDPATFERYFTWSLDVYDQARWVKQVGMRQCVEDDWVLLGDDYKDKFQANYLSYMFCPDTKEQFTMNDTFQSDTPDFIILRLSTCSSSLNPSCNESQAIQYLKSMSQIYSFSQIQVYLLDKSFELNDKNPVSYFINTDIKAQLTDKFGGGAAVEFSKYKIQTDISVLPWSEPNIQDGCFVDIIRNFHINIDSSTGGTFSIIRFSMNKKKIIYNRKVGKVDQLFSYVGGLFSTMLTFLSFLIANYNQYRYQLRASQGLIKAHSSTLSPLQYPIQPTQDTLTIWLYLKYSIFEWLKVFCCCDINWRNCKQIDQCREETIQQMDTGRILRRLNNMEAIIRSLCGSNEEKICISLLAANEIVSCKEQRVVMDYYYEVLKGRWPYSLYDLSERSDFLKTQFLGVGTPNSTVLNLNGSQINFNVSGNPIEKIRNIVPKQFQTHIEYTNNEDNEEKFKDFLQMAMTQYPQAKIQAENIEVSEQNLEGELKIMEALNKLEPQKRIFYKLRIPLIILYRILQRNKDEIQLKDDKQKTEL